MLRLKPISLRDANEYVRKYHRHHKPVAGHKFSIGCEADGELVGVIIAGRPVSRYLDCLLYTSFHRPHWKYQSCVFAECPYCCNPVSTLKNQSGTSDAGKETCHG